MTFNPAPRFLLAFTVLFAQADASAQTQTRQMTFADVLGHYQLFYSWSATVNNEHSRTNYREKIRSTGSMRFQRPDTIEALTGGSSYPGSCAKATGLLFLCPQRAATFNFRQIRAVDAQAHEVVFLAVPIAPTSHDPRIVFYVDDRTFDVRRAVSLNGDARESSEFTNVVTTIWR
jgi:hypothetical protein